MRYLILAVAVFGIGCASGGGQTDASRASLVETDDPLEPGDMIRLNFSVERQLDGEFGVDESYNVGLPLLGWTSVASLSGSQLRDSLSAAYALQIRNQTVQITLLRRIRVLGAVRQPGLYHVDPTMSLIDAIALAGGPTPTGKLDGVEIIRGGSVVATDIADTELVGSYVRSGDQIMVPERSWFSRNAGWVIGTAVSAAAIIIAAVNN
jgi:polysaccharide export outer membrane protein